MINNSSHEAEAFLTLLWRHIYQRVRMMLHPHHFEHEPGGKDLVELPIGALKDVEIGKDTAENPLASGDYLFYDTDHWTNGTVEYITSVDPTHCIGNLDDLCDVVITDVDGNQLLSYTNEGHKWINKTFSSMAASSLYLDNLADVIITTPVNNDVLAYDGTSGSWINSATAGGGGNYGQAFFEVAGTFFVGTTPGPTNLTGNTLTIEKVLIKSDGLVDGTVTAAGAFSFGAGGGTDSNTGLSYSWSDGTSLSLSVVNYGSPTYLSVDVYFTK